VNPVRSLLLAGSESEWLRRQAMQRTFVRRAVSRFMPGETLDDAIAAAEALRSQRLSSLLTQLGENVRSAAQARGVADHYLEVVRRIREADLDGEVSVKLTQLGLDVSEAEATDNLARIADCARGLRGRLWVDMESSVYTERTFEVFRAVRARYPRLGIAVQAYLHRSAGDVDLLIAEGAAVRLVKGAYRESSRIAMRRKADVDENFFRLAVRMLEPDSRRKGAWLAAGTHDPRLIARIEEHARVAAVPADEFEFAMLYGIRRPEQLRLASAGYRCRVLVSYGAHWFPWYMRRLAERPANLLFALRGIAGR